jgi:single-strand DNA-binding protein
MLNQIIAVGRLTKDPETKELENGTTISNITLAVQRSYKNAEGIYETDFIDCTLWNNIASNTAEYCHKGDIIGIKGRLQTRDYEVDGNKRKTTEVICEKVTFLSSQKQKENEQEEDLEV